MFGPHILVLRAYFCHCTEESLLAESGIQDARDQTWVSHTQNIYPTYYLYYCSSLSAGSLLWKEPYIWVKLSYKFESIIDIFVHKMTQIMYFRGKSKWKDILLRKSRNLKSTRSLYDYMYFVNFQIIVEKAIFLIPSYMTPLLVTQALHTCSLFFYLFQQLVQ